MQSPVDHQPIQPQQSRHLSFGISLPQSTSTCRHSMQHAPMHMTPMTAHYNMTMSWQNDKFSKFSRLPPIFRTRAAFYVLNPLVVKDLWLLPEICMKFKGTHGQLVWPGKVHATIQQVWKCGHHRQAWEPRGMASKSCLLFKSFKQNHLTSRKIGPPFHGPNHGR